MWSSGTLPRPQVATDAPPLDVKRWFWTASSNLAGAQIEGVRFVITHRQSFDSARLGLEIASALQKLYPNQIDLKGNRRLIGNDATIDALASGQDPRRVVQQNDEALAAFLATRERYLLYR